MIGMHTQRVYSVWIRMVLKKKGKILWSGRPVAVRLLDAAARRRGLARRLGGELLARGLATGALACGLLGAGHRGVLVGGRGWQYVLLGDDVLDERRS